MNILTRLVRPLPGWARGVIAALCVVAGIVLVFRPFVSLASMIWALAIALVVDGVLELIQMREHVSHGGSTLRSAPPGSSVVCWCSASRASPSG